MDWPKSGFRRSISYSPGMPPVSSGREDVRLHQSAAFVTRTAGNRERVPKTLTMVGKKGRKKGEKNRETGVGARNHLG